MRFNLLYLSKCFLALSFADSWVSRGMVISLIGVVVQAGKGFLAAGELVAVGVQEFAVYAVFFTFSVSFSCFSCKSYFCCCAPGLSGRSGEGPKTFDGFW